MEYSFRFIVGNLQNSPPDNLIWAIIFLTHPAFFCYKNYINKGMEQRQRPKFVTLLLQVSLINLMLLQYGIWDFQ